MRSVLRPRVNTVEFVQQVHFDIGNGPADGRGPKIETPEPSLAGIVDGERTPEYTLDDIDVCPSTVQCTLEIDLSTLDKGHKSAGCTPYACDS
jgi:hypothetical protein